MAGIGGSGSFPQRSATPGPGPGTSEAAQENKASGSSSPTSLAPRTIREQSWDQVEATNKANELKNQQNKSNDRKETNVPEGGLKSPGYRSAVSFSLRQGNPSKSIQSNYSSVEKGKNKEDTTKSLDVVSNASHKRKADEMSLEPSDRSPKSKNSFAAREKNAPQIHRKNIFEEHEKHNQLKSVHEGPSKRATEKALEAGKIHTKGKSPMNNNRLEWAQRNLEIHYQKHNKDVSITLPEYRKNSLALAREDLSQNNPLYILKEGTSDGERNKGDMLRHKRSTEEFVAVTKDYLVKTYFPRENGLIKDKLDDDERSRNKQLTKKKETDNA